MSNPSSKPPRKPLPPIQTSKASSSKRSKKRAKKSVSEQRPARPFDERRASAPSSGQKAEESSRDRRATESDLIAKVRAIDLASKAKPTGSRRPSLAKRLKGCFPAQSSSTEEEPSINELAAVLLPPLSPPPALLPGEKIEDIGGKEAIHTHLDALLCIPNVRCFVVSAVRAKNPITDSYRLGDFVMYNTRHKCKESSCKKIECPCCKVCPLKYKCNCKYKFEGSVWCPHLHVMQDRNSEYFLKEAVLFVHDSWRLTEMHHIRAFIRGCKKMKKVNITWEEQFDRLKYTNMYRVTENTSKNVQCACMPDKVCDQCDACLCKYSCTCEDSMKFKQVCEHVHNVAMQKHANRDELFAELRPFGSQSIDSPTMEEDHHRYYLEQEHELSSPWYFKLKSEEKYAGDVWHLKFNDDDFTEATVTQIKREKKCHCDDNSATGANSCSRCKICNMHYTCSCATSKFTICRHIHYVARTRLPRSETTEDKLSYYHRVFSRRAQGIEGETRTRIPKGLQELLPINAQIDMLNKVESFFS